MRDYPEEVSDVGDHPECGPYHPHVSASMVQLPSRGTNQTFVGAAIDTNSKNGLENILKQDIRVTSSYKAKMVCYPTFLILLI